MRERLDDDWRLIKVLGPYGPYCDQRGEYYKVVTDVKNSAGEVKRQQARTPTREAADLLKESLDAKLNEQTLVEPQAEATVADLLRAWRVDQEGRKTLTPNRVSARAHLQQGAQDGLQQRRQPR